MKPLNRRKKALNSTPNRMLCTVGWGRATKVKASRRTRLPLTCNRGRGCLKKQRFYRLHIKKTVGVDTGKRSFNGRKERKNRWIQQWKRCTTSTWERKIMHWNS